MAFMSVEKTAALLRIALGWTFFWAFLDKVFGLGFTTSPENAWLAGGSPTSGFLQFGTHGPFSMAFQALAGNGWVDGLFMLGLLGIGTGLLLGIAMRLSTYSGVLLTALMYLALIPPEHNPVLDEHIIYLLTFLLLYRLNAGQYWGLGKWWANLPLVQRFPLLK